MYTPTGGKAMRKKADARERVEVPTTAQVIRKGGILVLEDDPAVSEPLSQIVAMHGPVRVASSIAEAKRHFVDADFNAAILDENLPDGSGLDWLEELRAQGWAGPVLLLTGSFRRAVANRAQSLDAQCAFKPTEPDNVARFVELVMARDRDASRRLDIAITKLIEKHKLTRRESAALRAACEGVPRSELHLVLGVGVNTAKTQVHKLLKRVNEKGLDELVQRVLRSILENTDL